MDKIKCKTCNTIKSPSEFYKGRKVCKVCVSESQRINQANCRLKKHGMKLSDMVSIWEAQDKKCLTCSRDLIKPPDRCTHIDHDHSTGRVRGVLCRECNIALGILSENKETMKNLIKYIDK